MKKFFIAAIMAACAVPAMAQTNVSIHIGQPGFYGRIDLGDFAPAPVVYGQPVLVERRVRHAEPVYLRVPPRHRKNWSKHCARYGACGQQVYFVRDDWYTNSYAPRYRDHHPRAARHQARYERDDRGGRHNDDRKHDKDRGHGKHGKDNGNGHGRGHDKH